MAVYSRTYEGIRGFTASASLVRHGPVVRVRIQGASKGASPGLGAPAVERPVQEGLALVDTGAARTAVDQGILVNLGVSPFGVAPAGTPVGRRLLNVFPAILGFEDLGLTLAFDAVLGANLASQGIIALLGRDVLRRMVFVYDGVGGHVVLGH